jgi:cytochrome c oxidase cbb3-type subunit 3
MNLRRWALNSSLFGAWLFLALGVSVAQNPPSAAPGNSTGAPSTVSPNSSSNSVSNSSSPDLIQAGSSLFRQDCSFCHGRDAAGGESGPDLTRSKLVTEDLNGDKIGPVVRNGRPDKGMPRFDRSDLQIAGLVAFIHNQQKNAVAKNGGRKGVDVADLQTGNVDKGKRYFEGVGGCSNCHSSIGDLAGVATRYQGLALEEQMLYPKHVKSRVSVTLPSGETISGTLAYRDEFTVALTDSADVYRSWRTADVKYKIDSPVDAHVELFGKYTDDDVHNLMAYLQTLR